MYSILKRIFPELFLNDKAFKTENRYYVSRLKDSLKARAIWLFWKTYEQKSGSQSIRIVGNGLEGIRSWKIALDKQHQDREDWQYQALHWRIIKYTTLKLGQNLRQY